MSARFLIGDACDRLAEIEDGSVDLVVTSPPFLALRSYLPADHPDKGKEIGSESTPAEFLDVLLRVTAELRRVLAPHGSIAIELGDTYAGSGGAGGDYLNAGLREGQPVFDGSGSRGRAQDREYEGGASDRWDFAKPGTSSRLASGAGWPLAKSKTLIPELYRIALAYGINPLTGQPSPAGQWRIRNVVTWCRPNPPVGALGDKWRPATSDVVVACTSPKRYWDDLATRRPAQPQSREYQRDSNSKGAAAGGEVGRGILRNEYATASHPSGAPLLDYWEIPPTGYSGSHYAVYPPALVEPLVKAMCPPKVCRECGEPSRRIVESDRIRLHDGAINPPRVAPTRSDAGGSTAIGMRHGMGVILTTTGWSDCGHGVGCRPTTWKVIEVPVKQGRVRGGKWVDLDKWKMPIEPTETRIKIKRRRVVDDIGECADPSHWRPGLILDPFAGSGTTLLVATGHGHDAVGIDLAERNAELALERVGPFLLEVEA